MLTPEEFEKLEGIRIAMVDLVRILYPSVLHFREAQSLLIKLGESNIDPKDGGTY
jgi:hypothetical protein